MGMIIKNCPENSNSTFVLAIKDPDTMETRLFKHSSEIPGGTFEVLKNA